MAAFVLWYNSHERMDGLNKETERMIETVTKDKTSELSKTVGPAKVVYQCQVQIELKHPISWGSQSRYHYNLLIENRHCVSRHQDELVIEYHDDHEPMQKRIPYDNIVEYTIRFLRSRNESEPK